MKSKIIFGWFVLILISVIPIFLLLGSGFESFTTYSSTTQILGEITGLVGMTMFALTFILSTRVKFIEDVFGGLDKVYITHGVLGGTALILLLSHPILLVLKFIPENIRQAALYIIPGSFWSVNFGIISLLGMMVLIYLTLFSKIKYQTWKATHKFFGVIFIFAILHVFLVRGNASKDLIFNGYYIYASIVSIIGLTGFSYSFFIKDALFKAARYRISSVKIKSQGVFEIKMIPEHKPIEYKSGQFIFLRFYNKNLSKEAHPFSIASRTNNFELKIIVKSLGDFTKNLDKLKLGELVSIEGPYGRFNYNRKDENQIWIAGGIGIAPFLGIAEDLKSQDNTKNKIDLYYLVKDRAELIDTKNLKEIMSSTNNFRIILWVSKERGHLTVEEIKRISGSLSEKIFYFCGPPKLKKDIKKKLIKEGVKEKNIHSEEFGLR